MKHICMTTIQVTLETREMIREYAENESVDATLNRLFDESDKPSVKYSNRQDSKTNVNMSPSTFERLKEYKMYDTESHSDTLMRLLSQAMK